MQTEDALIFKQSWVNKAWQRDVNSKEGKITLPTKHILFFVYSLMVKP